MSLRTPRITGGGQSENDQGHLAHDVKIIAARDIITRRSVTLDITALNDEYVWSGFQEYNGVLIKLGSFATGSPAGSPTISLQGDITGNSPPDYTNKVALASIAAPRSVTTAHINLAPTNTYYADFLPPFVNLRIYVSTADAGGGDETIEVTAFRRRG